MGCLHPNPPSVTWDTLVLKEKQTSVVIVVLLALACCLDVMTAGWTLPGFKTGRTIKTLKNLRRSVQSLLDQSESLKLNQFLVQVGLHQGCHVSAVLFIGVMDRISIMDRFSVMNMFSVTEGNMSV